ncbi:AraC family transcriptional regulator [Vibrio hannami]|uniref:helix-turn-helix domain-containing protein n=1 Tax=Vibrio hannami TaxID=2717094 RepID=UPI00240F9569|nr:AraC family transcriptional regulator [Vibrio hannami]MDG3084991.1 AraC family transcriptional regulator [Vibrio hannami]
MNPIELTPEQYLQQLISDYSGFPKNIGKTIFASNLPEPPELAYQVHFQRLEIVVEGEVVMEVGNDIGVDTKNILTKGDALYIPTDCWNKPHWEKPAVMLNLLVGKQSFGISLLKWDGERFSTLVKDNVQRRGPRTGSFILQSLEELRSHAEDQHTARLLVASLLSHVNDLMQNPPETPSRSKALFEAVRDYIEQNYHEPLTRESVAEHFYVSPNYLSQLFQKEGKIKFNEHLNHIRLERAKYLLKEYDMKVKEVAHRCGFSDSNYFCRVFRNQTARSPSEYRTHYRSHS